MTRRNKEKQCVPRQEKRWKGNTRDETITEYAMGQSARQLRMKTKTTGRRVSSNTILWDSKSLVFYYPRSLYPRRSHTPFIQTSFSSSWYLLFLLGYLPLTLALPLVLSFTNERQRSRGNKSSATGADANQPGGDRFLIDWKNVYGPVGSASPRPWKSRILPRSICGTYTLFSSLSPR